MGKLGDLGATYSGCQCHAQESPRHRVFSTTRMPWAPPSAMCEPQMSITDPREDLQMGHSFRECFWVHVAHTHHRCNWHAPCTPTEWERSFWKEFGTFTSCIFIRSGTTIPANCSHLRSHTFLSSEAWTLELWISIFCMVAIRRRVKSSVIQIRKVRVSDAWALWWFHTLPSLPLSSFAKSWPEIIVPDPYKPPRTPIFLSSVRLLLVRLR